MQLFLKKRVVENSANTLVKERHPVAKGGISFRFNKDITNKRGWEGWL